jgi:hypothetical protein
MPMQAQAQARVLWMCRRSCKQQLLQVCCQQGMTSCILHPQQQMALGALS